MNRIFPQRPRAFLFDMDGTLYDSMTNHALSWYEMVREQGIEATPEEFFLYEGATGSYTVNMLYRRAYGRDASPEEVERLYQRKAEICDAGGARACGVCRIIAVASCHGIGDGLGTGISAAKA
jgi:beta-phosphoglucomutase-like phosphatase (HAD superfamily)